MKRSPCHSQIKSASLSTRQLHMRIFARRSLGGVHFGERNVRKRGSREKLYKYVCVLACALMLKLNSIN